MVRRLPLSCHKPTCPTPFFFLTPKRRRRRRKTITPSRSLPRSDVKRHLHALHLWTLFRHGRPRSCWGVRRRPSSQDLSFFPALLRLTSERSWTQTAQSPSLALSPRPFIPSGNLISRPGPSPSAPNPWSGLPGALPFARLPSPFVPSLCTVVCSVVGLPRNGSQSLICPALLTGYYKGRHVPHVQNHTPPSQPLPVLTLSSKTLPTASDLHE